MGPSTMTKRADVLKVIVDWDFDTFDDLGNGELALYDVPADVNVVEVSGWPSPGAELREVRMERVREGVYKAQ